MAVRWEVLRYGLYSAALLGWAALGKPIDAAWWLFTGLALLNLGIATRLAYRKRP